MQNAMNSHLDGLSKVIESPEHYREGYVSLLAKAFSEETQVDSILSCIHYILVSKQYRPESKFYAAFFLVKLTDKAHEEAIVKPLSNAKSLLSKVFEDAQAELKDKTEHRGSHFFSKTPTTEEAAIGVNYVKIMVELIKYWHAHYASTDKRSKRYIFNIMYTFLSVKFAFPPEYSFFGYNGEINENFHQTVSGCEYVPFPEITAIEESSLFLDTVHDDLPTASNYQSDFNSKLPDSPTLSEIDRDSLLEKIGKIVSSGNTFKAKSTKFLSQIDEKDHHLVDKLIGVISDIILNRINTPLEKFYSTLLLLRITETHHEVFARALIKNQFILNQIYKDAQTNDHKPLMERGRKVFSQNPTKDEQIMGQNYICLITEIIVFWSQNFYNNHSETHIFKSMHDNLSKRVIFPTELFYVGKNFDDYGSLDKFELVPSQIFIWTSNFRPGHDMLTDLQFSYERLVDNKNQIKVFFSNNPQDPKVNDIITAIMDQLKRELSDLRQKIIWARHAETLEEEQAAFVEAIYQEVLICDLIKKNFQEFFQKEIDYSIMRSRTLEVLTKKHTEVDIPKSSKDLDDNKLTCIVCTIKVREVVYEPCKHLCACEACSKNMKKLKKGCPICRSEINGYTRVFIV